MEKFEELAEKVKVSLNLQYDEKWVKYLEGYIERVKHSFNNQEREGLINSLSAFLGQCIIYNYGGSWALDRERGEICIEFDENNKVFPLSKVTKQFDNRLTDSIHSLYVVLPTIYKLKSKKKSWFKSFFRSS